MKTARLLAVPAVLAVVVAGGVVAAANATPAAGPSAAAPQATSNYTLLTEPDQGFTPVYNFINSAKSTIDMTMYELTDTTAEDDLAAAAARGVTVRVILDQNLEKSSNTTAFNYLSKNGVDVVWANTKYAATHQKTITVDGTDSLILTANLTSQYYATTRDFGVFDTNSIDVKAIEKVFTADLTGATITPTDGDNLVWSPTDSQTQLLALINSATTSLSVENEEMGLASVTTALENAAKRGVTVHVIMTNSDNDYATEFTALTKAGVKVATYTGETPIYVHAKAIVVDYGSAAQQVFLGSENFSSASLTKNRELGLTLPTAAIITSVNSTLSSDFSGGTIWTS
ncbi:MAG TPA: phospholipase D-like domain-containing protein [Pseudonocardiaceae bacterium]|jgi:phosphatidylserine/phosphatidylglycerophosphate/cardiolipin synthase-like enzyme|nr:phospholipase D-like domain-containing protein [Pseudonocardiaceae bacterium]